MRDCHRLTAGALMMLSGPSPRGDVALDARIAVERQPRGSSHDKVRLLLRRICEQQAEPGGLKQAELGFIG